MARGDYQSLSKLSNAGLNEFSKLYTTDLLAGAGKNEVAKTEFRKTGSEAAQKQSGSNGKEGKPQGGNPEISISGKEPVLKKIGTKARHYNTRHQQSAL